MKLSNLIKKLQDLQETRGDIEVLDNAFELCYKPLYTKNPKNGEFELSQDYLRSLDNELLDYLLRELEVEPTKQVIRAYNKAYDSHHSYGQIQVYWEFIQLLDLLEVEYKKDWQ